MPTSTDQSSFRRSLSFHCSDLFLTPSPPNSVLLPLIYHLVLVFPRDPNDNARKPACPPGLAEKAAVAAKYRL